MSDENDNCEACGYAKSAHNRGTCPRTATRDSFQDRIVNLEVERDKYEERFQRLTDMCERLGWEHCTTEVELIEQVERTEAEKAAALTFIRRFSRWAEEAQTPDLFFGKLNLLYMDSAKFDSERVHEASEQEITPT